MPPGSGDGRIIAGLLVTTDDPHARRIVMDLDPAAPAGVRTAGLIERASATGEINRIAEQLDLAVQVDEIQSPIETD